MGFTVRRDPDETFVELVELSKKWGQLPFLVESVEHEKLELIKQQFQTRMNQIQLQRKQALQHKALLAKLSVMDGWSNLSPVQQQQVYDFPLIDILGITSQDISFIISDTGETYHQQPLPFISAPSETSPSATGFTAA